MTSQCKICGEDFSSLNSLHKHIKKHDYHVMDYYVSFYPRKNKLTGEQLPFKDVESYFNKDFHNRVQMNKWLENSSEIEAKEYIQSKILERVYKKDRKFLPFYLELENCFLPKLDIIKKYFGSYSSFSSLTGIPLLFDKGLCKNFFDALPNNLEIAIDTREQKPLSFSFPSKSHKLSFGDYTLMGDNYNYTFVDRKSANDLCGTLIGENLQRFRRELQLAKDMDSFIFVVIESSISSIIKMQKKFKRKSTIDYILKNLRDCMYDFPNVCQFVFVENRKNASQIIPHILYHGKKLWKTDLQYFLDKHYELGRGNTKKS